MCSPSVASRAQAPAARTSNLSRHSAGSTRILSKLSIGYAWIALLVLPILGGRPNARSPYAATAAYKVAKPQAHLPQRLSTLVLPSTPSYGRQSLRICTPEGHLLVPPARDAQGVFIGAAIARVLPSRATWRCRIGACPWLSRTQQSSAWLRPGNRVSPAPSLVLRRPEGRRAVAS